MIKSFRNKALEEFYFKGKTSKIPKEQWARLRVRLDFLNRMRHEAAINDKPSWHPHKLHGKNSRGQDVDGHWSIWVTSTCRLTYLFTEDHNVILLDYIDYH